MISPRPLALKAIPTLSVLTSGFPGLKALFFDMDGTLFNTEPHHSRAFLKMGQDLKVRPPHSPETVHGLLMGKADYLVYEAVKEWEGFPKDMSIEEFVHTKNANLLEILANTSPKEYFAPEMLSLLQEAKTAKLFLALVTSSEKIITQHLLDLSGLGGHFDIEITRDDCPVHKPDPWPYLQALKRSGLAPTEALIFEDSNVGLTAALASGAHVIKVEWY